MIETGEKAPNTLCRECAEGSPVEYCSPRSVPGGTTTTSPGPRRALLPADGGYLIEVHIRPEAVAYGEDGKLALGGEYLRREPLYQAKTIKAWGRRRGNRRAPP